MHRARTRLDVDGLRPILGAIMILGLAILGTGTAGASVICNTPDPLPPGSASPAPDRVAGG